MVSISHITEKVMERKPFLQECLSKRLINVFALAEHIQPEVEAELNKKVKASAIMMSLRRLAEKLDELVPDFRIIKEDLSIEIKSNICEITVEKTSPAETYRKILKEIPVKKADFLTITQSLDEITILLSEKYASKAKKILEQDEIIEIIPDLTALIIRLPENNQNTPGLYYLFIRELAWHKISIVELVSTLNELIIILKDKDIPGAYRIIKDSIHINSKS